MLLAVERGGDDYAFVPPVAPSSSTDRRFSFTEPAQSGVRLARHLLISQLYRLHSSDLV